MSAQKGKEPQAKQGPPMGYSPEESPAGRRNATRYYNAAGGSKDVQGRFGGTGDGRVEHRAADGPKTRVGPGKSGA